MSNNTVSTALSLKGSCKTVLNVKYLYSVVFIICILYASFSIWYGTQPIDEPQKSVIKTLVKAISKAEERSIANVWAEVYKTYQIRSYADLSKRDYTDLVDRFSLRLQN